MSGTAVLIWLCCVLAPALGVEVRPASGFDAVVAPAAVVVGATPCWSRPAPRSPSEPVVGRIDETDAATETETQEDSSGSGPSGLAPLAIVPAAPGADARGPLLRLASTLRPARSASRLRC